MNRKIYTDTCMYIPISKEAYIAGTLSFFFSEIYPLHFHPHNMQ